MVIMTEIGAYYVITAFYENTFVLRTRSWTTVLFNTFFFPFSLRTFAAGNKIKQFYELLVEDSLRREDVDTLSRENMKNLHEIMQSFRFSNVCYWSYLSRTCLEIVLSIGLFLIYWCWGMPNLNREIECDVHGLKHSCVLPNHQFYWYILAVSSAFLCIYILCNLYNLIWIICPQLGVMYRIIRNYQEHMDEAIARNSRFANAASAMAASASINTSSSKKKGGPQTMTTTGNTSSGTDLASPSGGMSNHQTTPQVIFKPAISTDNFLNVYFDRRHKDLKLLLNLLAETSGLPESFRILTLLDKKFQSLWKPQNLRFEEYETVLPNQKLRSHSIVVRWNDAPIGHFLAHYDASLSFEYTIDINPGPVAEMGLKSVLYKKDSDADVTENHHDGLNGGECKGATERLLPPSCNYHSKDATHFMESGAAPPNASSSQRKDRFRYEVCFDNIVEQEDQYTVTISTELNGRTVTQMVEKFPMGQPDT